MTIPLEMLSKKQEVKDRISGFFKTIKLVKCKFNPFCRIMSHIKGFLENISFYEYSKHKSVLRCLYRFPFSKKRMPI